HGLVALLVDDGPLDDEHVGAGVLGIDRLVAAGERRGPVADHRHLAAEQLADVVDRHGAAGGVPPGRRLDVAPPGHAHPHARPGDDHPRAHAARGHRDDAGRDDGESGGHRHAVNRRARWGRSAPPSYPALVTSTLILLRHGESLWNAENRFTGWWDADLSP